VFIAYIDVEDPAYVTRDHKYRLFRGSDLNECLEEAAGWVAIADPPVMAKNIIVTHYADRTELCLYYEEEE
jgi:hypothetical protein